MNLERMDRNLLNPLSQKWLSLIRSLQIHTHVVNFIWCLLYPDIPKSDENIKCVYKISWAIITKILSAELHYVEFLLAKCKPNWQQIWKLCIETYWHPCVNLDCHCADIHETHAWDLRSSAILHNVDFYSVTEVLGQAIHPRFYFWIAWPLKMDRRLSRNVGN